MLWNILNQRFPQKENADELDEILGAVLSLHVKEGEIMKMWAARSPELFERSARQVSIFLIRHEVG